jgi:Spy/CpxP family protein refolding chaperone
MSSITTKLRRAAAVLAAGLALGLAAPDAGARRGGHDPSALVAQHAERLGLSPETREALTAIVAESEAREQELREEIRAARSRLRGLLSAPEIERDAVMRQADELDELHARKHRSRLEGVLRIHELLTPEQRAELLRIVAEEQPWHRGRGPLGRCSADLRALCADAPDGADALRCLADRWDQASDRCHDAVTRARASDEPGPEPAPAE